VKIYITDLSSPLGANIKKSLSYSFDCTGFAENNHNITKQDLLLSLENYNPDIIIHNREINTLRYCEENPRRVFKYNALLTREIASAAEKMNSVLIYTSSFQVFSGKKGDAYYEFDRPDPVNVYGWSKWWGEHYVCYLNKNYLILRLPLLFGLEGNNNSNLLLNTSPFYLKQYLDPLFEYITNPTWTFHVSNIISDLLAGQKWGTYHVGSTGTATLKQFVKAIIEEKNLNSELKHILNETNNHSYDYRYKVLQSAYLPYCSIVRDLPNWRDALKECINKLSILNQY